MACGLLLLGEGNIEGGDECLSKPEREDELGTGHEKLIEMSAIVNGLVESQRNSYDAGIEGTIHLPWGPGP